MRNVLAIAALVVLTFGLQWFASGWNAEFSISPDEPAHYVTGLMFTEYLRQGLPGSPLSFVEQYYVHYPKVAIGSWPPVFYVIQALWYLPLGSSKVSVYALLAMIIALTAAWIFWLTQRQLGTVGAFLLGVIFVLLPISQHLLPMMMSDPLITLVTLAATVCFARYLETGTYRDAILYALMVGATVLTKGSGVALVLIPVLAILLTRRWKLLFAKPLWVAAAIVVAIGAPWTLLTLRMVQDGWGGQIPFSKYIHWLWLVPWWHAVNLTIPVAAVGLLGAWNMTRRNAPPSSPLLISSASTVLAVLLFNILTPGAGHEPRRIFMAVPPTLLIAAHGFAWLREHMPNRIPNRSWMALAPSVIVVLLVALHSLPPERKSSAGFGRVAQFLIAKPEWSDCVALISSESGGEGRLISEVAVLENAPRRYLLRATKMLSSSSWGGEGYQIRFQTPVELSRYLDESPINLIVVDSYPVAPIPLPHHSLLWRVLETPGQWQKMESFSQTGLQGAISIYKHKSKACVPNPKIEVDLRRKIDRSVSTSQ